MHFMVENVLWYGIISILSSWKLNPLSYTVVLTNVKTAVAPVALGNHLTLKRWKDFFFFLEWWLTIFTCLLAEDPPSPVPYSLLVETLLSLTRWHHDDAIPTRPLSLHCLPNNKHRAKGSPMAYIVITYSERTHATSPPLLSFCSPLFSH